MIATTVSVAAPIGAKSYTVGGPDLTITPAANHFTSIACTEAGITNIPIQPLKKTLQYEVSANNWVNFPMNEAGGTFFSTNKDTSCVKSIDTLTLAITIGCSAIDKFAPSGT
jgi:hypothetical protein